MNARVESNVLDIATPEAFEPLLSPARYKGAFGGRGSAKSHFFAGLAVEESLRQQTDMVCIREIQLSLKQSVKKLIEAKIVDMNAGWYFDVQDAQILQKQFNGRMIFQGMQNHTAESIKSLEGYRIAWVEEAQSLSQRSLDLLRPTIRLEGSEIWFSWNPDQATDPVDALLRGPFPPPGAVVVGVSWRDNPFLPQVLRDEMDYDRKRDLDKYNHVWEGQYRTFSDALVFKNWQVEEFERPPGTIFRLGADWGYSIDPSVCIRVSIDGKRMYFDYEAYMIGCEIDQLPDLFDGVPESRKWFMTADSSRPETIAYMRNHGYPKINSAAKGPGSVEDGIEFMKSYDLIVHPRCVHLIDELKTYKWKIDPLTNVVLPVLEDKNNHVIDAARYAVESARKSVKRKPKEEVQFDEFGMPYRIGSVGHFEPGGWMGT
jgi:phage terminase large subunit